jgi:hypothetical protein
VWEGRRVSMWRGVPDGGRGSLAMRYIAETTSMHGHGRHDNFVLLSLASVIKSLLLQVDTHDNNA